MTTTFRSRLGWYGVGVRGCCIATAFCTACDVTSGGIDVQQPGPQLQRMTLTTLEDKVRGGWAGQMIGVSFGFPTEFAYREEIAPASALPVWSPGLIAEALNQDDLYVDMTFAEVMDKRGIAATTADYGAHFRDTQYPLWHANLAARRALRRGVPATLSGTPQYNAHFNDIDFQIEADFIGLMSPGMPQSSNLLSRTVGQVTNSGEGIYGGMFVSAMYAAAFFDASPAAIVEAGRRALPPASDYAHVIKDVLSWWRAVPDDWEQTWQRVNDKWNTGEMCPEGALAPLNIDAKLNGAYVAMGLLFGDGDFEKTMILATRAGQDSDCNPASALGILGVAHGFAAIPGRYTAGLEAIADQPFSYTDYSYETIVRSTVDRAVRLAISEGGRVEGDSLWVKRQLPVAAEADRAYPVGEVAESIPYDDERWHWEGDWLTEQRKIWLYTIANRLTAQTGATASVEFAGTGVVLTGLFLPTGGLADIYLNERLVATVDVYPDEPDAKFGQALWHAYDLKDQTHRLRVVVKGVPFRNGHGVQSQGAEVSITGIKVLR